MYDTKLVQTFQWIWHQLLRLTTVRENFCCGRRKLADWTTAKHMHSYSVSCTWSFTKHHQSTPTQACQPYEHTPLRNSSDLSNDQDQKPANICKQLLANNQDARQIVTGYEQWFYFRNPNKRKRWIYLATHQNLFEQDVTCFQWNFVRSLPRIIGKSEMRTSTIGQWLNT